MATLVLSAIGTALGGPLGGALGALIGQQADRAILGTPRQKGPRLKDLAIQTSSYGTPIGRYYGRMRVAGSVIWATELKESRDKQGGGKGKPKVVTYSYSASFAVALASRRIAGIGRIWADGTLLRGSAGDLKAGGVLRVHLGHGDQRADPLLAAAEGAGECPGFRGLAYLVFEDLALADFGNRIPALSVEVFADSGPVGLEAVLADTIPQSRAGPLGIAVEGFGYEGGSAAALIETIAEIAPLTCVADDRGLMIEAAGRDAGAPAPLPEPLAVAEREDAASRPALSRSIAPPLAARDVALRYYDVDRDYQPGVQRARGRSRPGEPLTVEFAAALAAPGAAALAGAIATTRDARRRTATCRIASADRGFAPGRTVSLPGEAGAWLVESWELDARGIALELRRIPAAAASGLPASDPGRALPPADLVAVPTRLAAFELPWDGIGAPGESRGYAAVSAAGAGWTGAALFVVRPDGGLDPLGASGRSRATLGVAADALGAAPGAPLDLRNTIEVELAGDDLALVSAGPSQLAMGANRALLGNEIVQFARAERIGPARWRLSGLLRGRGGTEWAIGSHAAGETFVVLDDALTPLDPTALGDVAHARVAAMGLADAEPVVAPIAMAGIARRPLSPVHGVSAAGPAGAVDLRWVRRSRGAWLWRDAVDAPLVEQSESYLVTLGDAAAPAAQWIVAEPRLTIDAAAANTLRASTGGAPFFVRQRGDHGLSAPLPLGPLP